MCNNSFFDNIEKKSNVNYADIFQIAQSISKEDLTNETMLRQLIAQISLLAGKNITKEKEDEILDVILQGQIQKDLTSLAKMLKN